MSNVEQIKAKVASYHNDMLAFFREMVAIPSTDSDIGNVGKRVEAELHKLNYDAVWWDKMGCIIGRIGEEDADYHLLYDSHLDTVGIGDPDEWDWDPFIGKEENGTLFARGACDEKASTPGMLYGLAIARDLGLIPDNMAVYYFGNIEEVNEGGSANAFVMTEGIRPDFVVVGEPTNLNLKRVVLNIKSQQKAKAHMPLVIILATMHFIKFCRLLKKSKIRKMTYHPMIFSVMLKLP